MTPGFDANNVVVGWMDLFSAGFTTEQGRDFYRRVIERTRQLPGVESVSISRRIPLGFTGGSSSDVRVEGFTPPAGDPPIVGLHYVGPDYMSTLKIQLIAGRDFSDRTPAIDRRSR